MKDTFEMFLPFFLSIARFASTRTLRTLSNEVLTNNCPELQSVPLTA